MDFVAICAALSHHCRRWNDEYQWDQAAGTEGIESGHIRYPAKSSQRIDSMEHSAAINEGSRAERYQL